MTQVFAAINHRLSEEYGALELPNQEAKARLLADAKYLHQKLSALKNVGAPTGMLETVVTEKLLPRTGSNSNSQAGPSKPPTRSNTLSANQRLKGLLTGKSSSFAQADKDKALRHRSLPQTTLPVCTAPISARTNSQMAALANYH
jgi:vacuolar protein sorting-associated protein 54